MSSRNRLLAAAAVIVVLILAFVLLKPGDDSDPSASETASDTVTTPAATTPDPASTTPPATTPAAAAGSSATYITLKKGQIKKIKVTQGDTVRVQVTSATPEELHIHGYDIAKDLPAGEQEQVSFKANLTGVYEMEFEDSGEQIAELTVEPK